MEILDLSHNDDLLAVIRKCNFNFKQLGFSASQGIKAQGRASSSDAEAMVADAINELTNVTIPDEVANQIANVDIPGAVDDAINTLDIPGQVSTAVSAALPVASTTIVSDFMTASSDVTITNFVAKRWGDIASVYFSFRLASALTIMSDGKINNLEVGTLKSDWMNAIEMTAVILDPTRQVMGYIDGNGVIKFASANSRGSSYVIDQNAVLYAGFSYLLA